MSKRALAIISTLAAAPAVALLSLAGPANAATPSPGYFSETTSLLGQGSYDSATFRTPAGAGDCVRTASSVTLSPISGSNNTQAVATWRSTAYTGHTNNADIWHMKFEFLTSDGRIAASTPTLDSAPDEQNQYSLQLVAVRGRQHRSGQLPRSDGGSGLQQLLTHGPWHARSEGLRPQPSWRTAVGTMRRLLHDVAG